jgi:hypothetical protein
MSPPPIPGWGRQGLRPKDFFIVVPPPFIVTIFMRNFTSENIDKPA